MDVRRKLFIQKNPYNLQKNRGLFLEAVKNDVTFHANSCSEYAGILNAVGFSIDEIDSEDALYKIPVIPTLYYKRNYLCSVPEKKLTIQATSSGTKGLQSKVGFDRKTLFYGVLMMIRFFYTTKYCHSFPQTTLYSGTSRASIRKWAPSKRLMAQPNLRLRFIGNMR